MNRIQTLWFLLTRRPQIIEINEPTAIHAWPTTVPIAAIARVARAMRSSRFHLVTYAIDNSDVAHILSTRLRLAPWLGDWITRNVTRFIYFALSRCVFGTSGATANYETILRKTSSLIATREIPALPSPCSCAHASAPDIDIVFLGAFDNRKGVTQLMKAWDSTPELQTKQLQILGKGNLAAAVASWCEGRKGVGLHIDPSRAQIHQTLARAKVLVLISQRNPFWREQVGLPILEGLSHGCTIVTTTETGLGDWLTKTGHIVVDPDAIPEQVGLALLHALKSPLQKNEVKRTLPAVDGRVAADLWLFADE
ncbi:hypothetical protein GCM10022240_14960 [Microbacterium kribbense]|uniref:Glycosyltransferase n=2 Tax=Microbacterium kribbense TaxID=433645 RepID=A0ABP7GGD6_9MICO